MADFGLRGRDKAETGVEAHGKIGKEYPYIELGQKLG
jgi:hypothetical protein